MDEATVKLIARYVREAGLIGQQSTGGGAARMTASDAASLLIAVNSTETSKDAAEHVQRIGFMTPGNDEIGPQEEDDEVRYVCSQTMGNRVFKEALASLIEIHMPTVNEGSTHQLADDPPVSIHVAFERPRINATIGVRRGNDPRTGIVKFYYDQNHPEDDDCDRIVESRFTDVTLRKIAAVISK